jgi:ribosome-associated protein
MSNLNKIESEIIFKAVRSSGKGGQNVNKVSTKAEIYFNIPESEIFSDSEKQKLLKYLKSKLDKNGILKITSQSERTQLLNKNKAILKLKNVIREALKVRKKRIHTSPTEASSEKRLKIKKIISERKSLRGKVNQDY